MVQPIMTSMGRTAKTFANTTGNRVISESFKDNNGIIRVVVTRVLNKDNKVLLTRMKCFAEKILKNGKKVLTRMDEKQVQEKVAGTDIPKEGKEYINKFFVQVDKLLSSDGKQLFKRELTYSKPRNGNLITNRTKILSGKNLESATFYKDSEDPIKVIRDLKAYSGDNVKMLQYDTISYNEKGLPCQTNKFDLNEFEIFNK